MMSASGSSAGTLGISLHVLRASNDADLDDAFAKLPQLRAGALAASLPNSNW
jgi:hypothetical protein